MELVYDQWWIDFRSVHKNDKDGGLEALDDLKRAFAGFSIERRADFIYELLRGGLTIFASELIELYGNDDQKKLIRERLREWLVSNSEESIGGTYVKTILRTFVDSDLDLLKDYFKEQRGLWFQIPIELYSIDKSMFLNSFEILLKRWKDESVYKYDGLLYLTNRIDVLEFLIDNLSPTQSKRMQQFCRFKSIHSMINTEKWRDELLALANKKR